jgi:hypothetical protein
VILSAQVVVRIDIGWLSLQRLARRAQGHVSIPLGKPAYRRAQNLGAKGCNSEPAPRISTRRVGRAVECGGLENR